MPIAENSVQALLEDVSSSSATPGGGSAAALAGALGAALVGMVCRLSVGKRRFAHVEGELSRVLDQADTLRRQLIELAEADTQAFNQVMAAYRLPCETDTQRDSRHASIQAALRRATQVPLETAIACASVVNLTQQVISKINPNAVSDAGAAALLAEAGLRGAQLNVLINLSSIEDDQYVHETRQTVDSAQSGIEQKTESVFSYVLEHAQTN